MEIGKGNTIVFAYPYVCKPVWNKDGSRLRIMDIARFKIDFPASFLQGDPEDSIQIDAIPPAAPMHQEIVSHAFETGL